MADITTSISIKQQGNDLFIICPNTTDDGDTFTVTLADWGMGNNKLGGIIGFIHTTEDSVIAQEQPTTSVTTGTLTVTVGGSTDNKKRSYRLWGEPE